MFVFALSAFFGRSARKSSESEREKLNDRFNSTSAVELNGSGYIICSVTVALFAVSGVQSGSVQIEIAPSIP